MAGVFKRLRDCHADELEMAMECHTARAQLHTEAEALLGEIAYRNLDIPDDLRERLGVWTDSLLDAVSLVDELRSAVLQPV